VKRGPRKLVNIQGSRPPSSGAMHPNKEEGGQKRQEACMAEQGAPGQTQNTWLWAWCHWWDFQFFDNGLVYITPGLLVTDRVHLSQREKRILVQEFAGLTERDLNQI